MPRAPEYLLWSVPVIRRAVRVTVDDQFGRLGAVDIKAPGAPLSRFQLRVPSAAEQVARVLLEAESIRVWPFGPDLGDGDVHVWRAKLRAPPAPKPDRAGSGARRQPRIRLDDVAVPEERVRPARVALGHDAPEGHA